MDYNQEQKRDRKTLLWAALAVLALLNIVLLYFFYQERQENDSKDTIIAAKTEEVLFTKTKLDSISAQLDAKIAEIQQLGGSVDSLISLKQQLEKDKQSLKNLGTYSAKKYEDKIRSYEAILNQKDLDIAQLKEELGIVTAKNEELTQAVSGLAGGTAGPGRLRDQLRRAESGVERKSDDCLCPAGREYHRQLAIVQG